MFVGIKLKFCWTIVHCCYRRQSCRLICCCAVENLIILHKCRCTSVFGCAETCTIYWIVLWRTLLSISRQHGWLARRRATYCRAVPTSLSTTRNVWCSVRSWALVNRCCCLPERFRNICVNMPTESLPATCQSTVKCCLFVSVTSVFLVVLLSLLFRNKSYH